MVLIQIPIIQQMEKYFRHARSSSFKTRARYKSSCKSFLEHVHTAYKLKNLRNLQDKHVVSYIKSRQAAGISAKTIKNDLAAIRYLHDLIPNTKFELSDNTDLKKEFEMHLDSTPAIKGDRGWTNEEFEQGYQYVSKRALTNQTAADTRDVMLLCRTMGLRIAEAVAMHRSQAEQALRIGIYQVRNEAKNGKWRKVPLSTEARTMLKERLTKIERGNKVFVQSNEKTHQAINRVEKYLQHYRKHFTTPEGEFTRLYNGESEPLTFHGLRYNYVQNRMKEEMDKGFNYEQAALIITKEVGHERVEVIKIYTNGK